MRYESFVLILLILSFCKYTAIYHEMYISFKEKVMEYFISALYKTRDHLRRKPQFMYIKIYFEGHCISYGYNNKYISLNEY